MAEMTLSNSVSLNGKRGADSCSKNPNIVWRGIVTSTGEQLSMTTEHTLFFSVTICWQPESVLKSGAWMDTMDAVSGTVKPVNAVLITLEENAGMIVSLTDCMASITEFLKVILRKSGLYLAL